VDLRAQIDDFLAGAPHAVVGVSKDRAKYGNKVLRCYLQRGRPVLAVHPTEREIEGVACVRSIAELPPGVRGLSIITPPPVTERVVEEAAKAGIARLWMQPGAESDAALARAEELGLSVIAGGPCLLVVLGYREDTRAQERA
jgi:predicted CoA-binding protein